jgi:hypothetical protein
LKGHRYRASDWRVKYHCTAACPGLELCNATVKPPGTPASARADSALMHLLLSSHATPQHPPTLSATQMHLTKLTFGDFLTYDVWCEAKKLLDFQIEQKATNKHYNKLGFYYFEAAKPCFESIGEEEYFEERIKTSLFYALQNEFYTLSYTIPKKSLGIRNYYFFSYPMMTLYYAVCLYLVKLTGDVVSTRKQTNIISFYGGNLYYKNGSVVINKNTTYYKNYHDDFKRHLNHFAKAEKNRYVIKLDIQNYY